MARNQYLSQHSGGAKLRYEMAMDLQQRPPEYGHRRHHTRHETEPVPDGRVVLVSNSPTNGGITVANNVHVKGMESLDPNIKKKTVVAPNGFAAKLKAPI